MNALVQTWRSIAIPVLLVAFLPAAALAPMRQRTTSS